MVELLNAIVEDPIDGEHFEQFRLVPGLRDGHDDGDVVRCEEIESGERAGLTRNEVQLLERCGHGIEYEPGKNEVRATRLVEPARR